MYVLIIQRLLFDAIVDVFYFPLWWYSSGSVKAAFWCVNFFKEGNERLAPSLWLANIFVPMFGQYDWQGRIISFFMRFFQVIIRGFLLAAWSLVCLALFLTWLFVPLVVVYGLSLSIVSH